MTSLAEIIAGANEKAGSLQFAIPAGWMQGRTAYGGLSTALALKTALRIADDLPPLRTAQISFIGPLAGNATVSAELLRRGRTAAFIRADIHGDAGLGYSAIFAFMDARQSHIDHVDLAAPSRFPDTAPTISRTGQPVFLENFDHFDGGSIRMQGDWRRWMRLKQREHLHLMVSLMAIADALPPGALGLASREGPISSMTWLINILEAQPETRDGWWLLRSRADYARHGCSSQTMGIWNTEGVPVATGMQSVALFT